MGFVGEHAVVLGASMAGLLSARVLAEHYRAVTVVERDVLPDRPENRRGVPQGRHVHSLLPRGSQILDELFPGIIGELIADGAPVIDGDFAKIYLAPSGHLLARTGIAAQPTPTVIASRPLLEWHVARRLRDTANVTVRDGHEIAELTASGDRKRVTGVRAIDLPTGGELTLPADLVVDAMGRGAHTPALLERLGYGRPAEKHIRVHATYTSQLLRIPGEIAPERLIAIGPEPGRPRGLGLFGYENDHWMFTTFGVAGDSAAGSAVAMREFVAPFAPAHILAALDAAEPVTDAVRHRFPSSQWRRYDKMRHFPDGLLPTGDAVASFNPIYAQGMTVAALQAKALHRCLRGGDRTLAHRFFRAAAKPIASAWQLATSSDLALPEVEATRSLAVRIANAYTERLLTAAETDAVVAERFARVTGLVDPPAMLLHPKMIRAAAMRRRSPQRSNGR